MYNATGPPFSCSANTEVLPITMKNAGYNNAGELSYIKHIYRYQNSHDTNLRAGQSSK
jgi:hypothetical protein